jgi:hypothetical protein
MAQQQRFHLLRDGELIDAVMTKSSASDGPAHSSCALKVSYRGRVLNAVGTDPIDALVALRGALEIEGLFINVPSTPNA